MKKANLLLLTALAACIPQFGARAQTLTCDGAEGLLSFEEGPAPARADRNGRADISGVHYKLGVRSLRWDWKAPGAKLAFDVAVPYRKENPDPKETSISSFSFWVYSPKALQGSLTVAFEKAGRECCRFEFRLGFQGWRGAWVAFDRDMQGTPAEGMDRIVITGPALRKGTLYFDGVLPAVFLDSRHHTPDFQLPAVNEGTTSHWLLLYKSWNRQLDIACKDRLTPKDRKDLKTVEQRFRKLILENKKPLPLQKIREACRSYGIVRNADGTVTGKPVFFIRYGETFLNAGLRTVAREIKENGQSLQQLNDLLYRIAVSYEAENDPDRKLEIGDCYCSLLEHLLDQGFEAGSGLGTLHHLGYCMRNFYTSPILMKSLLRQRGLAGKVQQAMEWFSGAGEVKTAPQAPGMDIDAFNTSLMGRIASVLMREDNPEKYAYMQAIRRWIDNGFKYTEGTRACFKTDGTVYHHMKAYPAYATGGFTGAASAVWMLSGTGFAISEESHRILKDALMEMRFYSNVVHFPLALSGRHPDGRQRLREQNYKLLAKAGSPDGKEKIDRELAEAFLRLTDGRDATAKRWASLGYRPEKAPTGTKVYGYNCSLAHRQDQWLVTIAGHSRYLWSAEIYPDCNLYGRYLTHGSMQLLSCPEDRPDPSGSGYRMEGWDWRHIPGTTAAEIPMESMKAEVRNADRFSGYEEMLLSDEWFAGGVVHKGRCGAFAMKLHENEKYNGSLRAHKSWFVFGNRIVALGSDIENGLPDAEVHTTLFQNWIDKSTPTTVNGREINDLDYQEEVDGPSLLLDRFHNAYFVKGGEAVISRKRQSSYHEKTGAPTEGMFEKAYLRHGTLCGKAGEKAEAGENGPEVRNEDTGASGTAAGSGIGDGQGSGKAMAEGNGPEAGNEDTGASGTAAGSGIGDGQGSGKAGAGEKCRDHYEYMAVVAASDDQIRQYRERLPYEVRRCDRTAHLIKDLPSGTVACAAFEETAVDELVLRTSPGLLLYSLEPDGKLTLSVSQPDLALYAGPADEKSGADGRRIERSVYSREWAANPCGRTSVTVVLNGVWEVVSGLARPEEGCYFAGDASGRQAGKRLARATGSEVEAREADGKTVLTFLTAEARTEEIVLRKKQ